MVVTPTPNEYEGDSSTNLLTKLTDNNPTTLLDSPAIGGPAGPGNMASAYEWDTTIQPGDTFIISNDQRLDVPSSVLVPEPTTLALLFGAGLVLIGCAGVGGGPCRVREANRGGIVGSGTMYPWLRSRTFENALVVSGPVPRNAPYQSRASELFRTPPYGASKVRPGGHDSLRN